MQPPGGDKTDGSRPGAAAVAQRLEDFVARLVRGAGQACRSGGRGRRSLCDPVRGSALDCLCGGLRQEIRNLFRLDPAVVNAAHRFSAHAVRAACRLPSSRCDRNSNFSLWCACAPERATGTWRTVDEYSRHEISTAIRWEMPIPYKCMTIRHIGRPIGLHTLQGRTVHNVIVAMETRHPHLTTQKSFYVEISRARDRTDRPPRVGHYSSAVNTLLLHFGSGVTVEALAYMHERTIAAIESRLMKLGRTDPSWVKKMLSYSAPPGYRRTKPVRRPKLDGFTGIVDAILEADTDPDVPRKQRHTAHRIFERLRDLRGHRVTRRGTLARGTGAGSEGRDLHTEAGAAGSDPEEAARQVPALGHSLRTGPGGADIGLARA